MSVAEGARTGPARAFSWSPSFLTFSLALVSLLVGAWAMTWNNLGVDSRSFYAVARVDAAGGDPDNPARLLVEEHRIEAEVGVASGRPSNFPEILYGYPPVMTKAWRLLVPLGDTGFFWINDLVLLGAGVAGLEMLMIALAWRTRWLARAFFVSAPAQMLGLLAGNPSNILLLGYGAAVLLMSRRRFFLGGLALGTAWVKPPIAVPLAAILVLAYPGNRKRAAAGALCGTALFATANLGLAGVARTTHWVQKLTPFLDGLSAHPHLVPGHCCLAGTPALFLDAMPTILALLLGVSIAGGLLAVAWRSRAWREAARHEPLLWLAALSAAALLGAPYIHMNDLVLLALPLLVLASLPLTTLSRVALTAWGLGLELPLAVAVLGRGLVPPAFYDRVSFGLVLSLLVTAAVCMRSRRLSAVALLVLAPAAAGAGVVASDLAGHGGGRGSVDPTPQP